MNAQVAVDTWRLMITANSWSADESDDSLKTKLIVAAVVFVLLVITAFAFGMDYVTPRWLIAILVIVWVKRFYCSDSAGQDDHK